MISSECLPKQLVQRYERSLSLPSALPGKGVLIAIAPNVPHADMLANGAIAGADILVLDPRVDGIVQIARGLHERSDLTQLHIISHGSAGRIDLGKTQLSGKNLAEYASIFQQWDRIHNSDSPLEILLYGCQIAKGSQGREFVEQLARLTGANITASTTLTGNAALKGNWQLDYRTGKNKIPLALTDETIAHYPDVFISTVAELITAINDANNDPSLTIIDLDLTTFNITSADNNRNDFGATGLPVITSEIIINGNGATIRRSGSNDLRFFVVDTTGTLTLNNLTLQNGRVTNSSQSLGDDGGAILNHGGTLTINNSTITENFAADDGGAIANIGVGSSPAILTIENGSRISTNNAMGDTGLDDGGGGIENDGNFRYNGAGATVTIADSFVTDNIATNGTGGGIRSRDGGVLTVRNTTITNNTSPFGGGIFLGNELPNPLLPTEVETTTTLSDNILGPNTEGDLTIATGTNPIVVFPPSASVPPNSATVNLGGKNVILTTNIPGITGLFPSLLELTIDSSTPETLQDNTNQKIIDLGAFNLGSSPVVTTFKLANIGTSTSEDLQLKDFNISPLFAVTPTSLATDTIDLGFGASTTFQIELDLTTAGVQSGSIGFNVVKLDKDVTTPFEFIINATVVDSTPAPTPTPTLIDPNNLNVDRANIFTIGSNGGSNLQVTLKSADIRSIENLKLLRLNDSNQTLSTFELFSALPDGFRPESFNVELQSHISGAFQPSDRFAIELQNINGETTRFSPQQLSVRDGGNGRFELGFGNGLTLEIQQTTASAPLGVGDNQRAGFEVIDLLTGGTAQANFTIYRDAVFDNVVGFYKIDDINGTVDGLAPGDTDYARAAVENRVSGLELSVADRQQTSASAILEGGSLYAPFIIVDSTPSAFLRENPDNSLGGVRAYFLFGAANPDGFDHLVLLGNNTFGFEDLHNGGDLDYNDLIFTVDLVA